ncbi:MAG: AMP-binding protein [Tatlockia sp.]|nr:AMP-binding protein [Tatlockia sp.]
MHLTCLLIGQDNLLIQCAKFLLARDHQIKWIVSSVESVQSWCEEHKIPCISSLQELPLPKEACVDYLFSIVNGAILKSDDLNLARVAAINYHDSLLPKYAGINATSWSILNGETHHGITWHLINEAIDKGDIVYQNKFALSVNETALSLNLRCFEEAFNGFTDIINKLETGTLSTEKQKIENRSYYGLNAVLPNMGFINWEKADANSITTSYRALNFGNYSNNLGSLKIYLKNTFLIIDNVEQSTLHSNNQPSGTVLAIENDGLIISTQTKPILIKTLRGINGKVTTASELTSKYHLTVNAQLPQLEETLVQSFTPFYKKALTSEKYWLAQLNLLTEHSFFVERIFDQNIEHQHSVIDLRKFAIKTRDKFKAYCLTSIIIYLYRINNYENFTIFYHNNKEPSDFAQLLSNYLPLSTHSFQSTDTASQIIELVNQNLEFLSVSYLNDLIVRQPLLKNIAHEIKEHIISFSFDNDILPENSLIHFKINSTSNEITISHRINCDFQGGSLKPVLENMSTHIKNVLAFLCREPETRINQFSFLSNDEQTKLLTWSVGEYLPMPSNTFSDLFEKRVRFSPNSLVIYEGTNTITYLQLWQEAEKITSYIQAMNLAPQSNIGIVVPLGSSLLALILGVLKSGCIAVPIDPDKILEVELYQLQFSAVFATQSYFAEASKISPVCLDIENLSHYSVLAPSQPNLSTAEQDCLLLISQNLKRYNQIQLINYSYWFANSCSLNEHSKLNISPVVAYDLITSSALSLILMGGALDFADLDLLTNPDYYLQHLRQQQISHLRTNSKEWESLLAYSDNIIQLKALKSVILTDAPNHSEQLNKLSELDCQFLVVGSV